MAIGAAASGRREAARHHGKRPARGDGRPSSAFRFGMPERNIRHNTITQKNEDESPHEFAEELRAHSCPRSQATASSQLCLLHKDCFVAWLNSTFVRPLQFTCLWPSARAAG